MTHQRGCGRVAAGGGRCEQLLQVSALSRRSRELLQLLQRSSVRCDRLRLRCRRFIREGRRERGYATVAKNEVEHDGGKNLEGVNGLGTAE